MKQKVDVKGLTKVEHGLRELADKVPDAHDAALASTEVLFVKTVKPKIPVRSGAARRSVVAKATEGVLRITAGNAKVQYFAWLDLGGSAGVHHSVHRLVVRNGRYMYPTAVEIQPKVMESFEAAISATIRSAGLEEV